MDIRSAPASDEAASRPGGKPSFAAVATATVTDVYSGHSLPRSLVPWGQDTRSLIFLKIFFVAFGIWVIPPKNSGVQK